MNEGAGSMSLTSLVVLPNNRHGLANTALYGGVFAAAVIAFCLSRLMGDRAGPTSDIVAVAGNATCGWSWLLVRALFNKPVPQRQVWPVLLVLALVAAGAFSREFGDGGSGLPRMIVNSATLVSSTLLLLATIQPLIGISGNMPRSEWRFRIIFMAGYASLLAIAVLWIDGAPDGSIAKIWGGSIQSGCALLALFGIIIAIAYRTRNPLPATGRTKRRATINDAGDLDRRLLQVVRVDAVFRQHDLRVADLARSVGAAEYKVTQSITGPLGFRNFNHMVNYFRIDEAKQKLADRRFDHLPVLTIALDCGFGSIGPFNRAFKTETGMTPTNFRSGSCIVC